MASWALNYLIIIVIAMEFGFYHVIGNSTSKSKSIVCKGQKMHLSRHSNQYQTLKASYFNKNCTVIDGHLIISYFTNMTDTSAFEFLDTVREITGYLFIIENYNVSLIALRNLYLIRGDDLLDNHLPFSLLIANNYNTTVYLPKLTEISAGPIQIDTSLPSPRSFVSKDMLANNPVCYLQKMNWSDIVVDQTALRKSSNLIFDVCHKVNCYKNAAHCFGPNKEDIQNLTSLECDKSCNGRRCFGAGSGQCCNAECAAGCSGPADTECNACLKFRHGDKCVDSCSKLYIYDQNKKKNIPNPNIIFKSGYECVEKCAEGLLIEGNSCVKQCGEGHAKDDKGVCHQCVGACPKSCSVADGTILLKDKFEEIFNNCTEIPVSFTIPDVAFQGDPYENVGALSENSLYRLQTVKSIAVINFNSLPVKNLSFLNSLEEIRGAEHKEHGEKTLRIYRSAKLDFIGWPKLKRINGDVDIALNKELCYLSEDLFKELGASNVKLDQNRDPTECLKDGKSCDGNCADLRGKPACWGPGPRNCHRCRNFLLDERECVSKCIGYEYTTPTEKSIKKCGSCHPECSGGCTGSGNDKCLRCKNFKENGRCVAKCSFTMYGDSHTKICKNCSSICRNDEKSKWKPERMCTGPKEIPGEGGCYACTTAIQYLNGSVFCIRDTGSDKKSGFFFDRIALQQRGHKLAGSNVFEQCHEECIECYGRGPDNCNKCKHFKEDTDCVSKCSNTRFERDNICRPCHSQCRSNCTGPDDFECNKCFGYFYKEEGRTHCVEDCRKLKAYPLSDDRYQCVFNCSIDYHLSDSLCRRCHSQCAGGCTGDGAGKCVRCKKFNEDGKCVAECSRSGTPINNVCPKSESPWIAMSPLYMFALGITAMMTVFAFIGCVAYLYWHHPSNRKRPNDDLSFPYADEPSTPTGVEPNQGKLKLINDSELTIMGILGAGAFGIVHKGVWCPDDNPKIQIPVAIKELSDACASESEKPEREKNFLEEAFNMASVNHQCLVRLLAVCMAKKMLLITQLMPHGSLEEYLKKNKPYIHAKHMLLWSKQIAEGMQYLESKRIIHRDLAARNVLVHSPHQVRITDFGLAKMLDINQTHHYLEKGKMPFKWLAIESIKFRVFTHESDVWSFGVTIWEILMYGKKPFEGMRAEEFAYTLECGKRLTQPPICTLELYMKLLACWMADPKSRPTFKSLKEDFEKMCRDPPRYIVIKGKAEKNCEKSYQDGQLSPPSPYVAESTATSNYSGDNSDNDSSPYVTPPNLLYEHQYEAMLPDQNLSQYHDLDPSATSSFTTPDHSGSNSAENEGEKPPSPKDKAEMLRSLLPDINDTVCLVDGEDYIKTPSKYYNLSHYPAYNRQESQLSQRSNRSPHHSTSSSNSPFAVNPEYVDNFAMPISPSYNGLPKRGNHYYNDMDFGPRPPCSPHQPAPLSTFGSNGRSPKHSQSSSYSSPTHRTERTLSHNSESHV